MKPPTHNSLYLLMILFYLVSLVPLTKVTIKSDTEDLREAVHMLQILQANTAESTQTFKKTLKYSIKTIQVVAGLQTIIFASHKPLENKPISLLAITFRFPYLPTNCYHLPAFTSMNTLSFPEDRDLYRSLSLAPETPPPIIS